eukprot:2700352-Prymnesium_polylepis.2
MPPATRRPCAGGSRAGCRGDRGHGGCRRHARAVGVGHFVEVGGCRCVAQCDRAADACRRLQGALGRRHDAARADRGGP